MKILVTGGAGFIGSHLTERCLNIGHKVFVLDDLSTGSLDNLKHLESNNDLDVTINTILNYNAVNSLINECDVIFHLAAAVGVEYIINNPLQSIITNIKGTENVLEIASFRKKKVLVASTSEVYGKSDKVPFREEDDRLQGSTHINRWSYACTKALDEFLSLAYCHEKHLPVIVARFFNVVGERQIGRYGMVIPRFIEAALVDKPLTVYGDGSQTRCFAYVKDVVDGIMLLINSDNAIGEVFNVGAEEEITILELAKKIIDLTHSKSEIEMVPYNKVFKGDFEDMPRRMPCLDKVKKYVGYNPRTTLDEILSKVASYIRGSSENK
jgi:UDP-glucose 4-epimerase